jgi:hypothetical protein
MVRPDVATGRIRDALSPAINSESGLNRLNRPVFVDRIVYATITMMSVLIIYDGWEHLKLIDVVGVIVGPVLAMFIGHVFSAAMARHVELGRVLTRQEWGGVIRIQAPFLLLCLPPLAVVSVLYAFHVSLSDAIRITLWFGTASLGYWGFVAGRRAGFVGWRMVAVVVAGLLIGFVILLLQVLLQPGKAFSGGVAMP